MQESRHKKRRACYLHLFTTFHLSRKPNALYISSGSIKISSFVVTMATKMSGTRIVFEERKISKSSVDISNRRFTSLPQTIQKFIYGG